MSRADILGVHVDTLTKKEVHGQLLSFLQDNQNRRVTTSYSEFVVAAQEDTEFRKALNSADINLADGIGILWAATFLDSKLTPKTRLHLFWTFLKSAWWTAFDHRKIKKIIPERISGADLVWDICELAVQKKASVYIALRKWEERGDVSAYLKKAYPDLNIIRIYEGEMGEEGLLEDIIAAKPDILLTAFKAQETEKWLCKNEGLLPVKISVALGGTFDYITGRRPRAGQFWQAHGLEWLHRLVTQPWRWKRIWKAIIVFSWLVAKEKLGKMTRSAG